MKKDMDEFDVSNMFLNRKILIEASAGTGKTYTIGLIVIRLLLEELLPIQKIVLITFTEAATAELKRKTAEKIIEALDRWEDNSKEDDFNSIIKKAATSKDARIKKANLQEAIACIDEMPVFTIHGFCTRLLNEFTYETENFEEKEIITNQNDVENRIIADFWRVEIQKLSAEEIAALPENFSLETLKVGIKNIINFPQAEFLPKEFEGKTSIAENYFELKNLAENKEKELNGISLELEEKAKEENIELVRTKDGKINLKDNKKENLKSLFPLYTEFKNCSKESKTLNNEVNGREKNAVAILQYKLAKNLLGALQAEKNSMKVRSFGDLIKNAFDAIDKDSKKSEKPLFNAVQKKYEAILIDEFQDTDNMQFRIFRYLFAGKPFFMIGDSKQAIYRFRGGDIDAYLSAKEEVENVYTLNYNFRSSQNLLNALNKLFQAVNLPFITDKIKYKEVCRKKTSDLPTELRINGQLPKQSLIIRNAEYENKDQLKPIKGEIIREIIGLLHKAKAEIYDKETGKSTRIRPQDIAILTRTNRETKEYREALINSSIPAIIRRSESVFKSEAADYIMRLLSAFVHSQKESRVKAALMDTKELSADDIKPFARAFDVWKKSGVMPAINSYLDSSGLWRKIRCAHNGERNITNIRQLMEILNEEENASGRIPERTLRSFAELIQGNAIEEHEEKLETDDDAVQIMTIHTSKGLQFPIVFVPDIMVSDSNNNEPPKYHKDNKIYIDYEILNKKNAEASEYDEILQESARVFYVAVTRPIYRLYIVNAHKKTPESAGQIICSQVNEDENIQKVNEFENYHSEMKLESGENDGFQAKPPKPLPAKKEPAWQKTSFSGIARNLEFKKNEEVVPQQEQQEQQEKPSVPGGKNVGNLLHSILENLDFDACKLEIQKMVENKLGAFKEFTEEHRATITEWIDTIFAKKLPGCTGKLCNVSTDKKMVELGFFMNSKAGKINLDEIKTIVKIPNIFEKNLPSKYIDGKIDLVFLGEDKKYYILDWKSNKLDNYSMSEMETEMISHSYHLQYYIYAVALKRWLKRTHGEGYFRENFGGVYYIFLRGVKRKSENFDGIYFAKADDIMDSIEKLDVILTEKE